MYLRGMRYQKLPSDLYVQNREAFMKRMKPGGLALFFSNDIYPTSADGTLPFKQHADIFYLAGVDQEETVLLLFPDAHNPADREISVHAGDQRRTGDLGRGQTDQSASHRRDGHCQRAVDHGA